MKLKDVKALVDQGPAQRAMQMLTLGSELAGGKKEPDTLAVPSALRAESVMEQEPGPMLLSLHGVAEEKPQDRMGLHTTGRTLKTASGMVDDLVLTPRARKKCAREAMQRTAGMSVEDLAVRQLGVGLLESDPHARVCAAYAYWQATGLEEPVLPILSNAIESADPDERELGAMCLAQIDPPKVRRLQGTANDDKPQTPVQPVKASMTVLIHGTFAKDSAWYQPAGDFHSYIKSDVYSDVYSATDFYFWSGRYHLLDSELKRSGRLLPRSWSRGAQLIQPTSCD